MTSRMRMASAAVAVGSALAIGASGCAPAPQGPQVAVLFPGSSSDAWGASAEVLRDELAADGYAVEVRFAGDDVPTQLGQLREVLAADPAAVVLAPVDATSIAAEFVNAGDRVSAVISYDRLALDAPEVDYFATFDHAASGRLRAQALLDGLGLGDPTAQARAALPVEVLAGSADDPAAQAAFSGALEVLQPFIDSGALSVPSGRIAFEQAAVLRGAPKTAATRVAELLDGGEQLAGVLSPSDAMSAAVAGELADRGITIVQPAGPMEEWEPGPGASVVLTGGGATLDGAKAVAAGQQTSTVYEDPRELARVVASMVREVVRGQTPTVTRDVVTDNGAREVPTRLLEPLAVTTRQQAEKLRG